MHDQTRPGNTTRHKLGRVSVGDKLANDVGLVNLGCFNRLVFARTRFDHHWRQLLTWGSNGGDMSTQVDLVLVDAQFGSGLPGCRGAPKIATRVAQINACKESFFDYAIKPFYTLTAQKVLKYLG